MSKTTFEVSDLKPGRIFTNGKTRKRIVLGVSGFFVYYRTPSNSDTIGEFIGNFLKWAKGVEE